jgi:hypothetical protein
VLWPEFPSLLHFAAIALLLKIDYAIFMHVADGRAAVGAVTQAREDLRDSF